MKFVEFSLRRLIWCVFLCVHVLFHVWTIILPNIAFKSLFALPYNIICTVLSITKWVVKGAPMNAKPHHKHMKKHHVHNLTMKERVSNFVRHHTSHHKRLLYGSHAVTTTRTNDPEEMFTIAKDPVVAQQNFGILVDPSKVTKKLDKMGARPHANTKHHRPTMYTAPLYNQHVGTILGAFRPFHGVHYVRDTLQATDGCTLVADWSLMCSNSGQHPTNTKPRGVIVIIPGLASSSQSSYIQTFVRHATNADAFKDKRGFHVCVLNTRGMGDTPLTEPKLMSASFTSDIRTAMETYFTPQKIADRCGAGCESLPVFGVGFSLGANVLCKYLGEEGQSMASTGSSAAKSKKNFSLSGAAAVCGPWDMHDTQMNMSGLAARLLYQPSMTSGLVDYIYRHADVISTVENVDFKNILGSPKGKKVFTSVQEFDQHVIVPHFGYESVHHYYSEAMCFPFIHKSPVPLLCYAAIDDPITGLPPADGKWMTECNKNDNVVYAASRIGGHIGFLGTPVDELLHRPNFMERYVIDSLSHLAMKLEEEQ